MKSLLLSSLLLPIILAAVVPKAEEKVDYSGFKVLRLALGKNTADLEAQIEELAAHVLNPGKSTHVDVVVSPDNVGAVEALALKSTVINEDVGAALEEEGGMSAYAGSLTTIWILKSLLISVPQYQVRHGSLHITPTPTISSSCGICRVALPASLKSSLLAHPFKAER